MKSDAWVCSDTDPLPSNAPAEEAPPLQTQVGGDHYRKMKIQPIEYIHANGIPFIEGNIITYVSRWRVKGGLKDLREARHFIDLLMSLEGGK